MSDVNDALPSDEKGSSQKLVRIAIVVAVFAGAFYIFGGSNTGKQSSSSAKSQEESSIDKQMKINAENSAIDMVAAFGRYDNDLVLLKDNAEKLEESISRIEASTKKIEENNEKNIKDLQMNMKREMTNITESFRKYSDINDSAFSNKSNIELGGIEFESESNSIENQDSTKNTSTNSNTRTLGSGSNYISLWDTNTEQTKNALSEGKDKVMGILSGDNASPKDKSNKKKKLSEEDSQEIPGQSWVEAQMFHGLRCPIINGIATIAGDTNAAPVTMKVRGIFHGPNGDEQDIGPVHIAGVCTGIRTGDDDYGIADIELTELSYSIGGKTNIVKIEGYILDFENEDYMNQPGLRGPIDKVQATTLADSALAAALSMASFGFQATQTTSVTNIANGTSGEIFTGNPLEQVLTQGLGGYFIDLYDNMKALKDTAVDAVLTKSGSKVRIFTKGKFSIPKVKPVNDQFYQDEHEESFL